MIKMLLYKGPMKRISSYVIFTFDRKTFELPVKLPKPSKAIQKYLFFANTLMFDLNI